MMRLSREELTAITGRTKKSAQSGWFKRHFGVSLPVNHQGPIITEQAYQELIRAKCGLLQPGAAVRPQVKLTVTA